MNIHLRNFKCSIFLLFYLEIKTESVPMAGVFLRLSFQKGSNNLVF